LKTLSLVLVGLFLFTEPSFAELPKPALELKTECAPDEKLETFQVRVSHKFQEQSACEKSLAVLVLEEVA